MITTDYLKEKHTQIHYFGLGFIQIKIDDFLRYHFYDSSVFKDCIKDNIHNHRYGFSSKILKGELDETTYRLEDGDDYFVKQTNCKKGFTPIIEPDKVSVGWSKTYHYKAGSNFRTNKYQRICTDFHTVSCPSQCITELNRTVIFTDYARVLITDLAELDYCPFETNLKEKELWEIVDAIIN